MIRGAGIRSVASPASRPPREQVDIVLHGLGPVVHQVLVDIVRVEQRGVGEGFQQVLGQRFDQRLGLAAHVDAFEARAGLSVCHLGRNAVTAR